MILDLICCGLYALAAGIIVAGLFAHQGPKKNQASLLASAALGLHAFILADGVLLVPGQNMSILNVASLVGWLISATMLLASFKLPNTILLPVVYGFTALVVLINPLMPNVHIMHYDIQPALLIHIGFALLAYACLSIAFLYALQLAYINLRLKEKKASLLHSSLPPLMAVETILFKLLLVGTVLLTLSLISGFIFLENMFAKEQAHKTVLSLLAWLIYSVILFGHAKFGWRGKPVITATIVGSIILTLAYFGSRFVREVLLG
ncbi:cytochrome C assembly family protein [Paraglaciecola hydrolytica]|uniref:Chromosome partitioning protein ParB n=1 Tax=Paraglaciecola hydrolytica TaxID=1799789 RepID=A0A136A400_9ALTE|nr:cytochrome c biogenesis protein CcsA [Paraglaciecola hydrolytica]KXI29944.1 chromosome partitioning protein ParB [Paraglaciecola hydrolytica]